MTRRVPDLHVAMPEAQVWMHPGGRRRRAACERATWPGSSPGAGGEGARRADGPRNRPPRGTVFVPWFDEGVFINKVTLDATCPISKETDFKKCAVKVHKA